MKKQYSILVLLAAFLSGAACTDNTRDFYLTAPVIEDTETVTEVNEVTALHVDGRYLKNEKGEIVNLHGFAQTFSPYFNQYGWNNYDVDACLAYNQKCFDGVLAAGWKMNFVRQHMDPYWTSPDAPDEASAYEYYDRTRFMKYLNLVFIPMAEYAIERGCYVVMRPPGVSPKTIAVGDDYNKYLIEVWDSVSNHPSLKNNPGIMFELANEPVNIVGTDGSEGSSTDAQFEALQQFLQPIVDVIRENGCNNVLWLPGLAYQSQYSGFANHMVEGENLGFAIHCYCGWYGSDAEQDSGEGIGTSTGGGYTTFQQGWDAQIKPAADFAPIMVTEMDWALSKYNSSWGKGITGTAGGEGFGANFKYIVDNTGNVSWLLWTTQEYLMQFKDEAGVEGAYTFLNDPEACPWPVYHWYEEYAGTEEDHGVLTDLSITNAEDGELTLANSADKYLLVQATYSDGTQELVTSKCEYSSSNPDAIQVESGRITALYDGEADITISYTYKEMEKIVTVHVSSSSFPLEEINPSIWETGSFNTTTHTLITGQYGFGGWQYSNGLDLSASNYLIVELCQGTNTNGVSAFRLFDVNNYWGTPASYPVNAYRLVIDLKNMTTESGVTVDPSHLYIIGFWTHGGENNAMVINRVYTSLTYPTDTYTPSAAPEDTKKEEPEENPGEGGGTAEDLEFSLSSLNPNIWEKGSFDTSTGKLLTGQYGFAGWEGYWDLSSYKYMVVELKDNSEYTQNGWSFRMFNNSYWTDPYRISLSGNVENNRLVVDLTQTLYTENESTGITTTALDLSKVIIVGFWSRGSSDYPIYLNKVYATNTLE